VVFFNTLIPSSSPCQFGGTGWLMAVSTLNGGRPDTAPFDVDGNNEVDEGDLVSSSDGSLADVAAAGEYLEVGIPAESAFLSNRQYTPDSSTSGGTEINERALEALEGPYTGRLSWEEVIDD
jgi:type IV pilus assembly protein PilY1